MAKRRYRRTTKKELKRDRFIEKGTSLFVWLRKHKAQASWIIVCVSIVLIGTSYFWWSTQAKQGKAHHELSQAILSYGNGRFRDALTRFEDVSKLYPRTIAGIKSTYWLGNLYYLQAKYKESRSSFQQYLTKGKDPLLLAGALLGIADTYLQEGNYFKASQQYEEFATHYPNSPLAPKALLQAIRCYQLLNQPTNAKSTAQTLHKNYPNSPYTEFTQGLIMNLM